MVIKQEKSRGADGKVSAVIACETKGEKSAFITMQVK